MNEWEKAQAGYLYDANYDPQLAVARNRTNDLCFDLNQTRPSDAKGRGKILKELLPNIHESAVINSPFFCDYGQNIRSGERLFINYNCVFLDAAPIIFGNDVYIAPGCIFSTSGHPLDAEQRNKGLEIALPITVGDSVWFGASVTVIPGVTIGSNVVIAAGSIVNKDIPDGVVAGGNPCRVIRAITEEDKNKYPVFSE